MPLPAPKPLDWLFDRLNFFNKNDTKPGDIEYYKLKKELDDAKNSQPQNAYLGLAILAAIDADEDLMRDHMQKLFYYTGNSTTYNFNYGSMLIKLGCTDEAISHFNKLFTLNENLSPIMDQLAYYATLLDDKELTENVLSYANKHNITSENIIYLAKFYLLSEDQDNELNTILDNIFPEEFLLQHSIRITDEKWSEMMKEAKELESYL